ncbi:MAG: Gfo/Idh/MocA family oxidoreductase [Chloroflexi bacterium]|nr:Gfo/Idh/MocA family oxidoreductase [Chloroflexota bacterium]
MVANMNVGIIGCGNIAPRYVQGCNQWDALNVVACADINSKAAAALANNTGINALSIPELLADFDIGLVINLTIPAAHAEVSKVILLAGKHVYSEKPLAITREDGAEILALAEASGLRVGSAPDTFLGGGLQTCRKLIDEGAIGEPVAATAFMMSSGPESWHPNPPFFYQVGAGPLFDMGPYYLTTLIHLLGPIRRLTSSARISFTERVAGHESIRGQRIPVYTPTHVSGSLEFQSGPIATMVMSFDVQQHTLPRIEIYGSEGTLIVPDPNTFKGPVRLWRLDNPQWVDVSLSHSDTVLRGIGVADMVHAIATGRDHRANGRLAFHVLDNMLAMLEAAETGRHVTLTSTCDQPLPLPVDLPERMMD